MEKLDKKNVSKLDELLIKAQIEGIRNEIRLLKKIYFNTIADVRFDKIQHVYEWDAEKTTSLTDKLEIYKAMYLEIVEYISQESKMAHEELILKYYPECANLPDMLEYQSPEQVDYAMEGYPFD